MTKEEIVEYLASISGIKETVLDNFKYKDDLSKVAEQDLKRYAELYESIQPYVQSMASKLAEEFNKPMFVKASDELEKLIKSHSDLIQPTLLDELVKLTSQSNQFEQWQKELDKLNEISEVSFNPNLSLSAQHLSLGIDSPINTQVLPISSENKNLEKENNQMSNIKINKMQLSNFRFFIDDEKNNTFEPNKNGMLIYGENGSGKSSLFKAFDFLSKTEISEDEFRDNKNIFNIEQFTSLNFEFDNDKTPLSISDDNLSVDSSDTFITNLSVFKPILNYQELLKISYIENDSINEQKNLYTFFEKILEDYPILGTDKKLKYFEDEEYFDYYKNILQNDLFDNINLFLGKFNHGFKINKIKLSGIGKKAFLEIDYFEKDITNHKYHLFLNEARLSALAMSIYFSIIKKQFDLLEDNSLKILVLDDLLISLDMNNRLSLIKILQENFNDYQIFFFTHEKGLFDLINEKMNLASYEIYVTKKDDYEVPFIKQTKSLLEQAIYQKDTQNYGCSANLLRQFTEKKLCEYLPVELTVGAKCKKLTLDSLLTKSTTFEKTKEVNKNQELIDAFTKLKTFKRVLLNDASHYNSTDIYKGELEDAIEVLEELKNKI